MPTPGQLPPWCREGGRAVLPGDIVVNLEKGIVSVVIRRIYADEYLVIPKYVSPGHGPWKTILLGSLFRIIETYAPNNVRSTIKYTSTVYSPQYGTSIPIEKISQERKEVYICSGAEIAYNKDLTLLDGYSHYKWTSIITWIGRLSRYKASLPIECLWPTGSILLGSFIASSDIDIVYDISDPNCLKYIIEFINNFHEYRPYKVLSGVNTQYIQREAKWRSIDPSIFKRALRPWQRLIINGVEVSLSLVNKRLRSLEEKRVFRITDKIIETLVEVEPFQETIGDYPSMVEVDGIYLVSYDGIYAPLLLEGGRLYVRGIKAVIETSRGLHDAIVVGIAEKPTLLYRAK